ncbi:unnamed protein product, partial [marine sediment metagenome]
IETIMRKSEVFLLVALSAATALSGCGARGAPVVSTGPKTPAQRNFDAVWHASLGVLRGYSFEIDRQDRRAGVITTLPMTGRHWFEFWRKDAATPADVAEGAVQTLYRSVTVSIRPDGTQGPTSPQADTFRVSVEVRTQRSDRATPQINSTADALDLFRGGGADSKERALYLLDYGRHDKVPMVPLGRDHKLEAKIQSEITAAAGVPQSP